MSENKRIHIRKDCLVPVRYVYEGQNKTLYARLVNYSDGGMCLKTRTPIKQGAKLELSLEGYSPESDMGDFDRYPVAVCWSKEIPERGLPVYETGLKYRG
ncbi:MAG: PilZ domain-containing protein [Desulfomicrobium sp.]|nr:PilZ domain-containing protein [Pseudomonadota bacterium]MBV1713869.1 PilZ domain-containing protein [Desulfomicrobium sp.]MBU4572404.1 PilZ domain-containing protein [Pseudomonadota bacterium]MBU4594384.1 PilZ domain-containing protein [Pseudomonadota bacterium]MBV1719551.1 PilZ domain-containing protein [Desulfomicrobium sp.]